MGAAATGRVATTAFSAEEGSTWTKPGALKIGSPISCLDGGRRSDNSAMCDSLSRGRVGQSGCLDWN